MISTIQSKDDLRMAYWLLNEYKELAAIRGWSEKAKQTVIEVKKSIRAFLKRDPERRIIRGDMDGFVELIEFPESIKTEEQAISYFENEIFIPVYYSQYDCTGRPSTSGYKIFQRRGRFHVYHSVIFDV